jgi:hypothetical protein
MKIIQLPVIIVLAVAFATCSSQKESTGVWVNKEKIQGKSFDSVFIVVMTADIEARSILESDLADRARSKGYVAIKSIDVLVPKLSDPKMPAKEDIIAKVKESGCDAVFIASLLKKEEAVHYTPGTQAYSITPYYSYYGTVGGYYNHWAPTVSTPDYYSKEKNYFMLSNLYDAATEEIMWSVQSEIFNPSTLGKFSKSYTATLIQQLDKEQPMKQQKKK